MIEAQRFSVSALEEELHYQLEDPHGEVVATVSPVSVGEFYQISLFKHFLRFRRLNFLSLTSLRAHIPRIVLRVADSEGRTLFFIDRAAKTVGNPCPPHYAAISPEGEVIGHITNDHHQFLAAPDGPPDADGTVSLARWHLLDGTRDVLCDIVVRVSVEPSRPPAHGTDLARYVGQDGSVRARKTYGSPTIDLAPDLPPHLRYLVIAHAIGSEIDNQHQMALLNSTFTLPAPFSSPQPYPLDEAVHSHYMAYQEEYVTHFRRTLPR